MRPAYPVRFVSSARNFLGFAAVIALPLLLAACASSDGGGGGGGGLGNLFKTDPNAGVAVQKQDYDANFFLKSGYCPPVQILPGTESLVVYEKGHDGDTNYIRTQSSITRSARECVAVAADTLQIKVGVAGRVLAGPKGGAGTVKTAIRVAVTKQTGGKVLFSKAFPLSVQLTGPDYATDYSEVFDQVTVKVGPDDRDLIVYIGFDEGGRAGT